MYSRPPQAYLPTKKDFRDEVFFVIYEGHEQLSNSRLGRVHGFRVDWLLHSTTQVNVLSDES
jgi:hypothetical protein